jgi:hypothetical protein
VILRIELRASRMLGKCSLYPPTPPPLFAIDFRDSPSAVWLSTYQVRPMLCACSPVGVAGGKHQAPRLASVGPFSII